MNKVLLEYEIKRKGYTIERMCKELGISRSAFFRKCNGSSEFKEGEIAKIMKLLELKSPMGIFFAN